MVGSLLPSFAGVLWSCLVHSAGGGDPGEVEGEFNLGVYCLT